MQREAGLVLSNVSQPASYRRSRPLTRSSRCGCLAPEPIRLEALRPRCGSLPLPERSFASEKDVSDVTHHLEPAPARRSGEGAANERSAQSVFFVSISRRARASTLGTVFQAIPRVWFPASLPRRAHRARRVDRVPARSCRGLPAHDVHSCVELGELGPLPAASIRRRRALSVFALRLPCTRGARLGGDPGPFDRCLLLTDSIFKDETPSLDARRTARPHAMRELSVHAAEPTSASRPTVAERCLLRPPFCRRTSDAPSPRGLPRRSAAASTGVGPRTRMLFRARDLRVEPEGLDRRHQAA